jgi:hypothetical protein
MKPETSDAPHDTTCDFEQVETNRADRRRRQSRAREDRASEVREQQQPLVTGASTAWTRISSR